jgi:processive 1,2-diacylglycerol beta-glucosyltransferase
MPRILIISASVGAGHVRAAQALELALKQLAPDAHVHHADMMKLCTPLFARLYGQSYMDLVSAAPHLIGMLYTTSPTNPLPPNPTRSSAWSRASTSHASTSSSKSPGT